MDQASDATATRKTERPGLVVFDVNETLSDLGPLSAAFESVGLPGSQVEPWFAGVLRDGFALTSVGANPKFADLAREGLRQRMSDRDEPDALAAADEVMSAFTSLSVHPDVADGVRKLHEAGIAMITLSNGSTGVAQALLDRAELTGCFQALLSVEDAGAWKPHPTSYEYALRATDTAPDRAMLVAVHPWDIDGAARAGLRTGWLNRHAARFPSYFHAPGIETPTLVDLAERLSTMR